MIRLLLGLCLMLATLGGTSAHDLRPAYLALTETSPGTYDVFWKVPAMGDRRLSLTPQLPASAIETPREGAFLDDAYAERWAFSAPDGLSGETISIDGLAAIRTDALVRIERLDGGVQTVRLTPSSPALTVAATQSALEVAKEYFLIGVEHILSGLDHLLFVLGLLLLLGGWRRIAVTITAFTIAHSITLAAAALGFVHVPPRIVEPLIALSILFLAVEVARSWRGEVGLTSRYPWAIAFAFGLVHGLGFAGGLSLLGLPASDIPLALMSFNLGVEAGQIAFVVAMLCLFQALGPLRLVSRAASVTSCYVVGTAGAFWVFERVTPVISELLT